MRFLSLVSLIILGSFQMAQADAVSGISLSNSKRTGSFFAGGELAILDSPTESLSGYGLQVGYQYVLTGRYAVDASLSQIYGSGAGGSGLTALYSGISAAFRWAPFREFSQNKSDILFEGRKIFQETIKNESLWSFGIQMNQLFLNGDTSIYNATGLGVVVSYDTNAFGYDIRPEFRYAMMTANVQDLSGMFFNLLMPF